MNKTHYGMQETKDRILEYLATIKLRMDQGGEKTVRAPAIFLVGLVGTGKTTFAYSLAETLGRRFARIPFGGLGSAQDLRGKSRLFAEAEPGAIVKALRDAGSMNPIILLDEIDRVGAEERADIMGVLVELLDPTQNNRFLDHYLDFPLDLSQVLFVATANNTTNVATAVLDRLELIQMPSYTDEEKIHISREYLLPKALKNSGLLPSQLTIEEAVWPVVARPLGYDAGIRTLERTLAALTRRVAREIVEGKTQSVKVDMNNYKQYMKAY
jgi:ATP-dependent Lon protease